MLRNASLSRKLGPSSEGDRTTPPEPSTQTTNWELEIRKIKIKNAVEEVTSTSAAEGEIVDDGAVSQREQDWAFVEGARKEPPENWDSTSSSSFELLAVE